MDPDRSELAALYRQAHDYYLRFMMTREHIQIVLNQIGSAAEAKSRDKLRRELCRLHLEWDEATTQFRQACWRLHQTIRRG